MTINLNSPLFTPHQESRKRGRKPKDKKMKDKPLPITSTERRVSEEIPPVVILTSPQIPSPSFIENEVNNNNRKRKTSITINSNINERKKKKIVSPEISSEYQDVSFSDR